MVQEEADDGESASTSDTDSARTGPTAALRGKNHDWIELNTDDSDEGQRISVAKQLQELRGELLRALNSDSFVVLAGLGTSLGIPATSSGRAPNMWDLWNTIKALPTFEAATAEVPAQIIKSENIEHLLSHIQARLSVDEEDAGLRIFLKDAQDLILDACSFINADSALETHQMFLRKIGRRSARLQRTKLFTTNYDLAFEEAAARARFHMIDGFGMAAQREFDGAAFDLDFVRRGPADRLVLEENVMHLMKLHGSVDWDRNEGGVHRSYSRPKNPVLIYPSANKYQMSFRQPYLEMMSRLQMVLRLPDVALVVVGFGFSDEHISAPIEAAVRSNVGLRLVIVDPKIRNTTKRNATISWLEGLAEDGDHRLTLIEGTFSDLVRLMPDASEFDERQAHSDRLSRVDGLADPS